MRVWVLLAVVSASALASDKTFCEKKCASEYMEGIEKTGCLRGCEFRGAAPNAGMFFFIDCHRQCDFTFGNSTTPDGKACHFACSLPMVNSVFMSVNYNKDGKPEVKVIRHDGPHDELSSEESEEPAGSDDFFKEFQLKPMQHDFDEHTDHFRRMEEQIQGFLANMRARLANAFDSNEEDSVFGKPMFKQQQQHTGFENPDTAQVGNLNDKGRPIIKTHPVIDSRESDDSNEISDEFHVAFRDRLAHPSDRWFHSARKAIILQLFLLAFSILSIMISVALLLRIVQKRRERYQRVQLVNTHIASISVPPPLATITVEKKVPLDDFEGAPPKDGVPPPAYDQLSISSIHKKMDKSDD